MSSFQKLQDFSQDCNLQKSPKNNKGKGRCYIKSSKAYVLCTLERPFKKKHTHISSCVQVWFVNLKNKTENNNKTFWHIIADMSLLSFLKP